jgi:hypothetical protein
MYFPPKLKKKEKEKRKPTEYLTTGHLTLLKYSANPTGLFNGIKSNTKQLPIFQRIRNTSHELLAKFSKTFNEISKTES